MFLPPPAQERLAGLSFSLLGRHRRRARRQADHTRAQLRFEGLEDRCLMSITEFLVPTAGAGLSSITAGPDGNLWFTERGFAANKIGMINPITDAITEFAIPTAESFPTAITAGPDGNLWFLENDANQMGEINPTTGTITEFPIPSNNVESDLNGITVGPDGNLWFSDGGFNSIAEFDLTTHAVTHFPIPTPNAGPVEITTGPDGNLWFSEVLGDSIGEINPTTHAISEFPVPAFESLPTGITVGPDGNLWFTERNANQIGVINPTTDAISEFAVPTADASPLGITAGSDGNLWFTEGEAPNIGTINPTTDEITEYVVPYAGSSPSGITAGPDGNIWFTDAGTNSIGVDALNADHFVLAQQPPASVIAGTPFGLTVEAESSSGGLDSSFNGTVTVALANNPGGTTLGGTLTSTASGGIATFSGLTLNTAASGYTLNVTSSGVDSATTSAITVTPAPASQLVFTQQPPANVVVNAGFLLQATIEDPYGNVETDDSAPVTAALATNPDGATLGGALSVNAIDGVASFSGLTLSQLGSGYTLAVSSNGLTGATSSAITVIPVPPQELAITLQPQASALSFLNLWVDGLQFDACIIDLHLPVDAALGVVDVRGPSGCFFRQGCDVPEPSA